MMRELQFEPSICTSSHQLKAPKLKSRAEGKQSASQIYNQEICYKIASTLGNFNNAHLQHSYKPVSDLSLGKRECLIKLSIITAAQNIMKRLIN